MKRRRGFVLITVLVIVAIMALVGVGLLRSVDGGIQMARSRSLDLEARAAAENVTKMVIHHPLSDRALPPLDHPTHHAIMVRRIVNYDEDRKAAPGVAAYYLFPRGRMGQGEKHYFRKWDKPEEGGTYPANVRKLDETSSPYIANVGEDNESGFECEAHYRSIGPRPGYSQNFYEAYYEVGCLVTLNGGAATSRASVRIATPLNYKANIVGIPIGR